MDKNPQPESAKTTAYTMTLEQGTFRFNRPTLPQLDRYLAKASRTAASAGQQLSLDLVIDEDRELWSNLLQRKPGVATAVVQEVMEDMGFMGEATSTKG